MSESAVESCGLRGRTLVEAAGLIGPVWLLNRRRNYRRRARTLDERERASMDGFFTEALLESVRISAVRRIADPMICGLARAARIAAPPSLETMAGLAMIDTVVIASGHRLVRGRDDTLRLLFHELVHVVQFRLLGVRRMVRRYVRGWVESGYDYWSIPLEKDAYELGGRFAAAPGEVFSVEDEVRRRIAL